MTVKTVVGTALATALAAFPACQAGDGDMTAVLSSTIQSELLRHDQGLAIRPSMQVAIPAAELLDEELTARYIRDRIDGVPEELVDELVAVVGRRSGTIERLGEIRSAHVLLSTEQEAQLVEDWKSISPLLSETLGGAWSALHFAAPPVIEDGRALAYFVINEFPPYAAEGRLAYLRKSGSAWRVEETLYLWSEN